MPHDPMHAVGRETYLLIAGAWHGAWCWDKLVQRLEVAGHSAVAPELAGHTLEQWTRSVCEVLQARQEPAILVGHSRGGIVISQAAERLPHQVKRLVYVSGFLLGAGQSVLRLLREDGSSPLLSAATLSQDQRSWQLDERQRRGLFYGLCSDEDAELACRQAVPEPVAPLMTPIKITAGNFGRVPRAYIHCLRDAAVPYELQKKMVTALPCNPAHVIDTDHSPFFSAPDKLAAKLLNAF